MNRLKLILIVVMITCGAVVAQAQDEQDADSLRFTFIGNSAFLIEDGEFVIAADFPYRSGSRGYMQYDFEEVKPGGIVVCLITHGHPDHWEFAHYVKASWALIGPRSVTSAIRGYETIPIEGEEPIEWESILVEPRETYHGGMEHYSFLVTWHGVRMYFSGDAESTEYIMQETDLDVAFVTPWLLAALKLNNETVDADRIVIHHHYSREVVQEYADRVVPAQGGTFEIPFRE